jgi:hypothetical protein
MPEKERASTLRKINSLRRRKTVTYKGKQERKGNLEKAVRHDSTSRN